MGLGLASGLSLLARPNLLFALPFTAVGVWLVTKGHARSRAALFAMALGVVIALTPMAARNWLVTGRPTVLASHGGSTPFFIGNGPRANGLWNSGGGLLSGQVAREQVELARRLGVDAQGDARTRAISDALYARAFEFMRTEPLAWLALEGKKLKYTLGNREHVHDFDLLGERELLGLPPPGVPFGVLLALGALGLHWLWRVRTQHAALLWVISGQLVAVLLANLIWFTASQHRMPLVVPLALCAGPMLADVVTKAYRPPVVAVVVATLLGLQAFIAQEPPTRPSAVHYYNLALALDILGRHPEALPHYRTAAERAPKQPMFALRYARLARRMQRDAEARPVLERLLTRTDLPEDIAAAARAELRTLDERAR
jgi:hypothetical protein